MDLRQLEMLLAVVEAGSYVKAGERLRVSHSAIHRQVRLLEHEVHDRILVRSGRYVELTEIGEILLNVARRLRQEIAAAERQIADRQQLDCGHLRIGTGTTMLVFFLPAILDRFRKQYPGVDVHVMTGTADRVLEEIEKGHLDAGIILASSDMPGPARPLVSEVLYRDEFVLAVSKNHSLARSKAAPLAKLVQYPFIMHSKTSHMRRVLDRLFAEAGLVPKVSMELENEEAMEKMIEFNMCVAMISRRRAMSDGIQCVRLEDHPIFSDVSLVYADSEYMPRTVKEFSKLCRSFCTARASAAH